MDIGLRGEPKPENNQVNSLPKDHNQQPAQVAKVEKEVTNP